MAWDKLRTYVEQFDLTLDAFGLNGPKDSPVAVEFMLIRDFLNDDPGANGDQWLKQRNVAFNDFYRAAISVRRLAEATVELQTQPPKKMRERLTTIFAGSITQDFKPSQAKDKLYELEMALAFTHAGFDTLLREPDLAIAGHGLSRQLGVACKYLASMGSIHEHISKGHKQIIGQNMQGFVSIGTELFIVNKAFAGTPPQLMDFRGYNALQTTQQMMSDFMRELATERSRDYPAEKPLDGALTSFCLWGIDAPPVRTLSVNAWALQVGENNPLLADLQIVEQAVDKLKVFD